MIWCSMSLDSFSSWEVRCNIHEEHYPEWPQRGSKVIVGERVVKWCMRGDEIALLLCLTWFFFLSDRDMLHNLPLHMCGRDQLWIVPLSPLHVWHTRGHQSWLWLVHVLRMGRTGPYLAGWFLVYTGSFSLPSTDPGGAQAQAGERLCVTGCCTSNRHLSHPETVMSPVPETVLPRDSEQREASHSLARRKQRTLAVAHMNMNKRWHLTEDDFSYSGAFILSLFMNELLVLLLALQEENSYTKISSSKIC